MRRECLAQSGFNRRPLGCEQHFAQHRNRNQQTDNKKNRYFGLSPFGYYRRLPAGVWAHCLSDDYPTAKVRRLMFSGN